MLSTKRIKRYTKEIKYNYLKSKYIIYTLLFISIIIGLLLGSIINKNMTYIQKSFFKNYIETYFNNFKTLNIIKCKLVIESILKYSKGIIIIWILGFVNMGWIISIAILIIKFISLGLVSSFFLVNYGILGLLYSFILYIPQNLILIPMYFYITYYSIKFDFKNRRGRFKGSLLEYFLIFIISMSTIFFISLYEIYITPNLINYILSFKK